MKKIFKFKDFDETKAIFILKDLKPVDLKVLDPIC